MGVRCPSSPANVAPSFRGLREWSGMREARQTVKRIKPRSKPKSSGLRRVKSASKQASIALGIVAAFTGVFTVAMDGNAALEISRYGTNAIVQCAPFEHATASSSGTSYSIHVSGEDSASVCSTNSKQKVSGDFPAEVKVQPCRFYRGWFGYDPNSGKPRFTTTANNGKKVEVTLHDNGATVCYLS